MPDNSYDKSVYIVGSIRSPQSKAGGSLKDIPAPYLCSYLVRGLLDKLSLSDDLVDEVIIGNVGNPAKYPNIGRVVSLEAGLSQTVPAHTVHRNCASGLEAVNQGVRGILSGADDLVVVGGTESMSSMPLMYGPEMTNFFMRLMGAKSAAAKLQCLTSFRPKHLAPVVAIKEGLTDPFCGLNMGQTAEVLAREIGITRDEQDAFAQRSHERAVAADSAGHFTSQIAPIVVGKELNKLLSNDEGPRAQSTLEKLAKLRPYFEPRSGTVTVGNSCPITDGASAVVLASEVALEKHGLKPLAKIVALTFVGLDPKRMGMGPLVAMDRVLDMANMAMEDMSLIEINEAFAAQVLAVLKGCRDEGVASCFGVSRKLGEIPADKLNVNGGAIALGHPIGSTGSRLIVTLAHELARRGDRYGMASLCIGGGQGGAVIIENMDRRSGT